MCDFMLPPWRKWNFHSFGMLYSTEWHLTLHVTYWIFQNKMCSNYFTMWNTAYSSRLLLYTATELNLNNAVGRALIETSPLTETASSALPLPSTPMWKRAISFTGISSRFLNVSDTLLVSETEHTNGQPVTDIKTALLISEFYTISAACIRMINTRPQQKWHIETVKCKTCNQACIGQTSRNLSIRFREHIRYIKNSDPPISLCTAYPTKHPRIWHPGRHYDTIKTITRHHQTNPIWTAIHPSIPPQQGSHQRTVCHWTQPVIPVGDMHATYHTATNQYLTHAPDQSQFGRGIVQCTLTLTSIQDLCQPSCK